MYYYSLSFIRKEVLDINTATLISLINTRDMSVAKIHKKSLTATVSPDIIVSIDQLRGEIPRSRAVEHTL